MKNPVDVERQFNKLVYELAASASLRYKWEKIGEFLAGISKEFARFDTFLLQLVPHLPVIKEPLTCSGINPDSLIPIIHHLVQCEKEVPALVQQPTYQASRDALLQYTCMQLALVGEFHKLIKLYCVVQQIDIEEGFIESSVKDEGLSNREQAAALAGRLRLRDFDDFAGMLDRIVEDWSTQLAAADPHSVLIPVVEQYSSRVAYSCGRLRRLTARVTTEEQEGDLDTFTSNFMVVGAEQDNHLQTENIAEAVRARIRKTHPQLGDRFFNVLLSYDMFSGWHVGNSSQVGAASISYCAILGYCGCRQTYTVNPTVAVTGELDSNGTLVTIDPSGIKAKTEALFFSWANTLVVPEQQKAMFEAEAEQLFDQFPNREAINIIGIRDLEELFVDRRTARRNIESRTKYYLKRVWEKKFSAAGTFVIIFLLLLLIWFVYGPIDKNPVNGIFKGEHLFVENQYGQTIVQLDAGYRSDSEAETASSGGPNPQVQFVDINADNINEIIWATNMSRNGEEIEYFKCWSVTGDSLVWQRPAFFNVDFPRKSGMVDNHFFIGELLRTTLPDDKTYIISRLTMREMFPGLVILLDSSTGKVESKYIHAGQVSGLELVDINGDGISEVFISGINNAFSNAFAAALELQNIGGHSPVRGDYEIKGAEQADELHYLLIPKTKVGRYLDPIEGYNRAGEINFAKEDSLISVWIRDGQAHAFEGIQRSLRIIAHLDFNFMPQGFSTSDQYDIVAEELHQEGKIKSIPDYEYFEAFKDSILYWDGSEFVHR